MIRHPRPSVRALAAVCAPLCLGLSSPASPPPADAGNPADALRSSCDDRPDDSRREGPEVERHFFEKWHQPYGASLPREYLDATWRELHALPSDGELKSTSSWELVGPLTLVTSGGGRYTGRILDIEQRPDWVWLAAATGGLWSCWLGVLCSPMTDQVPSQALGSFAVHPTDTDTILLGTGEAGGASGTGLYRTTDNGDTWTAITLTPEPQAFFRVRYAPDGLTAHAATTSGYYRSTNGGVSWTQVRGGWASDLAIDPANAQRLYMPVWGQGLFTSTDAGVNWTLNTGSGMPTSNLGRGAVAVAASDPTKVYVAWSDANGNLRGVYRTTDSGTSWSDVSPAANYLEGQGGYDNVITVSPTDADTVLVGGVSQYRTTVGGTGGSWTQVSSPHLHVDYHAYAWGSGGRLWAGHDGGISFSDDAGVTWSSVTNVVPITQYYRIHASAFDAETIAGAAQDNGISVTTDGGGRWDFRQSGDGAGITIDPNDPARMWSTVGVYRSGPWTFQRFRSTDAGASWNPVNTGIDSGSTWLPKIRNDQVAPVYLYTGWNHHIYESSDFGDHWSKLNPTAFASDIGNLAVSRYESPKAVVYAVLGTTVTGQRLWVYDDDGWYARDAGLPAGVALRAVFTHPSSKNIAFALVNGLAAPGQKVFRTDDRGQTWTNITGNLPNVPLGGIVAHPTDSSRLYLGTEMGCFRSTNGGQSWHVWNNGMPDAAIVTELWYQDLRATGEGFWVVAGTYGRSIWRREVTAGDPCRPAYQLSCPEEIAGATTDPGATNVSDSYACSTYPYTGPEFTYGFQVPSTTEVTVSLHHLTADLDLMVLQETAASCDPESCFAASSNSGTADESVTFTAVGGTTYHFVVDGYAGAEGDFLIRAECRGSGALIFSDGFESGSTSAWSSTVP